MGLLKEQVQIMCYVTLETTCGKGMDSKVIDVNYLIMDTLSPYNIILGPLRKISTMYLALKFSVSRGWVGIIRGDQQVARECYHDIVAKDMEELALVDAILSGVPNTKL